MKKGQTATEYLIILGVIIIIALIVIAVMGGSPIVNRWDENYEENRIEQEVKYNYSLWICESICGKHPFTITNYVDDNIICKCDYDLIIVKVNWTEINKG